MASSKPTATALPGVSENRAALRGEYLFRRWGCVFLLVIILLALGGLFSNGYLSAVTRANRTQTLSVSYQRFGRLMSEFELKVEIRAAADRYWLRIGGALMRNFKVTTIWPTPDGMYSEGDALILLYNKPPAGTHFPIWLTLAPLRPGEALNIIQLNNEPALSFWQFIYP